MEPNTRRILLTGLLVGLAIYPFLWFIIGFFGSPQASLTAEALPGWALDLATGFRNIFFDFDYCDITYSGAFSMIFIGGLFGFLGAGVIFRTAHRSTFIRIVVVFLVALLGILVFQLSVYKDNLRLDKYLQCSPDYSVSQNWMLT